MAEVINNHLCFVCKKRDPLSTGSIAKAEQKMMLLFTASAWNPKNHVENDDLSPELLPVASGIVRFLSKQQICVHLGAGGRLKGSSGRKKRASLRTPQRQWWQEHSQGIVPSVLWQAHFHTRVSRGKKKERWLHGTTSATSPCQYWENSLKKMRKGGSDLVKQQKGIFRIPRKHPGKILQSDVKFLERKELPRKHFFFLQRILEETEKVFAKFLIAR